MELILHHSFPRLSERVKRHKFQFGFIIASSIISSIRCKNKERYEQNKYINKIQYSYKQIFAEGTSDEKSYNFNLHRNNLKVL